MDLFRIERFLINRGQQTILDCGPTLEAFRVPVDELRSEDESLSTGLERRSTLRSLDMAKLSIAESKGTIRLTWLATIFIPISLASSIFGMNVREIDSATTPIWHFAVTAVVLLVISAYSWCLMRALHNLKVLPKDADMDPLQRIARVLVAFPRIASVLFAFSRIALAFLPVAFYLGLYDKTESHTTAVLYFLGFKRLDDALSE
ncbi:hypothetical protein PRZ48_007674 [Zasmidium cellare]|uniref:Uncharacterized protein n=1 Tax=Zasmidium cellare TaxID=395010 RepID=A0ABR0EKT1_ZASCE|nr:hypothetical protein PRZ48_007674 [Zasmidium cellare]